MSVRTDILSELNNNTIIDHVPEMTDTQSKEVIAHKTNICLRENYY